LFVFLNSPIFLENNNSWLHHVPLRSTKEPLGMAAGLLLWLAWRSGTLSWTISRIQMLL